jgi:hypothetical protein
MAALRMTPDPSQMHGRILSDLGAGEKIQKILSGRSHSDLVVPCS